ncbi:hypothetical protein [Enterococcus sp. BWR-S5]|uniref:hypothetical protein n=1 Tax=Enterococcus sp. BWR-S5 TaxID=2787714 RepID=UPI0019245B67|nr:hypothetical protein [Enterococcus sp. BWR-S5]MBL1227107.1 hypothetical protein [Enterococcus sp. BWR-S5]
MKKKWIAISMISLGMVAAFMSGQRVDAAQSNTDILQEVIGKTLDGMNIGRGTGLGQIANGYGKLAEFQEKVLTARQERLDELVAQKRLKQAEAVQIITKIKDRIAACDGSGTGISGQGAGNGLQDGSGAGIGGQGAGNGLQDGSGAGIGGQGAGNGLQDGSGAGIGGQGAGNGLQDGSGAGIGGQGAGNGLQDGSGAGIGGQGAGGGRGQGSRSR